MKKIQVLILLSVFVLFQAPVFSAEEENRMKNRMGVSISLLGDPVISIIGLGFNYNLTPYLRLTSGVGVANVTLNSSQVVSALSVGLGAKALVPGWSFSPVLGLNFSETFLGAYDGGYAGIANGDYSGGLFLVYANGGFDYQAADGFNIGIGANLLVLNAQGWIPTLYIGKYF